MPLPLPNLDDRRWRDLVDEATALIPRLAPDWTDYNVSDPGITLIDLLAWITEADIFGLDRVPASHRERFVALAAVGLRSLWPARTPLQFATTTGGPLRLPDGIVFAAGTGSPDTAPVSHSLRLADGALEVLGCALTAVQVWTPAGYLDRTQDWRSGAPFAALGPDPAAGAALLLGFDPVIGLDPAARLSLWLGLDDAATADLDPRPGPDGHPAVAPDAPHHSAMTSWEFHDGAAWQPFVPAEVTDLTRSLTRSGRVVLPFGALGSLSSVLGAVTSPRRWIRVTLTRGRHDVAPRALAILADAAPVVQARPGTGIWPLAAGAGLLPSAWVLGATVSFGLRTDPAGRILGVDPAGSEDPTALVLDLPGPGNDTVGLSLLSGGVTDGAPSFVGTVPGAPFTGAPAGVWTANEAGTQRWDVVDSLLSSAAADHHVVFDLATGAVSFGDGRYGRIPGPASTIIVAAEQSLGTAGSPSPRTLWRLANTDAITRALTAAAPIDPATLIVRAPAGTIAAAVADDLPAGEGRAADQVWTHERLIEVAPAIARPSLDQLDRAVISSTSRPERAVTALDFERMALEVPGTSVLRARALPGLDPALPQASAPGTVSVVIVPGLPASRPVPTAALLEQVRSFLCPRRSLGTRLIVAPPSYVEVSVTATVRALPNVDANRVRGDALTRLYAFLHPLSGGPAGRGWPFGRDVHQAELLRELDLIEGLDHVEKLSIFADGTDAGCGNVCVGDIQLVVSGTHEVTVR